MSHRAQFYKAHSEMASNYFSCKRFKALFTMARGQPGPEGRDGEGTKINRFLKHQTETEANYRGRLINLMSALNGGLKGLIA